MCSEKTYLTPEQMREAVEAMAEAEAEAREGRDD